MKTYRGIRKLALVMAAGLTAHLAAAQQPAEPPSGELPEVELVFQNTTTADVALYVTQPDDTEERIVEKLAPGEDIAVNALPGNVWVARLGEVTLAEYEADGDEQQFIDLAYLATWQLPVQVVFQNTTGKPAQIAFVKDDGQESVYAANLQPEKQFEQGGVTPGSVWRVKQNSKVVAEYISDNIPSQVLDLKALVADYARSVTLTFKNTSTAAVDIYWVHPDGSEVLHLPQLPSATQVEQRCHPNHVWMIRQEGALVGVFVAGNEPRQDVDIGAVAEKLFQASQQVPETTTPAEPAAPEKGLPLPKPRSKTAPKSKTP